MGQAFSLQSRTRPGLSRFSPASARLSAESDEGPRYEGAHGPAVLPADRAPDATRVRLGDGEATPAWGMRSQDRSAVERGVRACGDRFARVAPAQDRPHAGALAGGRRGPVAIARRRRGKVAVERPGGEEVAWFKPTSLSGEMEDDAAGCEDVALVLLLGSNAATALERRVPLPFSPFVLVVVVP